MMTEVLKSLLYHVELSLRFANKRSPLYKWDLSTYCPSPSVFYAEFFLLLILTVSYTHDPQLI